MLPPTLMTRGQAETVLLIAEEAAATAETTVYPHGKT